MSDQLHAAWFQIHLSTAIVLMFVAGGMIWRNVTPMRTYETSPDGAVLITEVYGWPLYTTLRHKGIGGGVEFQETTNGEWITSGIVNGLACCLVLVLIARFCEWFIRRREARAP